MSKKRKSTKDARWAEAKRLCRLNADTVRMAKELGLNPRSLIKNIPSKSQPWKAPVHVWIRDLYEKRRVKAARKQLREGNRQADDNDPDNSMPPAAVERHGKGSLCGHHVRPGDQAPRPVSEAWSEHEAGVDEFQDFEAGDWFTADPPDDKEIAEQNDLMLRRQKSFRIAAGWVAEALSDIPAVRKVALFGSVAVPLEKEVPRFREFRKAGIAIWHECKDVDLAVWVDDLSGLRQLQRARSRALNDLSCDRQIYVAHHQVEIFILDPDTDRYLGRLCCFGKCPKHKHECRVPGCGAMPFLQQHDHFTFRPDALASERIEVLYDRNLVPNQVSYENEIYF
jgi:hypothetical protein